MTLDALDFRYLLIENYKKMGLSELELSVILVIDYLLNEKNTFVTADLLSLKMNLSPEEIDKILVALMNKNILTYETSGKNMLTSLEPLKRLLTKAFQTNLAIIDSDNNDKNVQDSLANIYAEYEKLLGRTLSPLEFSKIREWISYGYSDQMIIDALKDAISKNKKSFRSVDKILLQKTMRNDIDKEGYTAISEKWEKDIDKTIEIAKTKWIDDDDDK